MTSVLRTPPQRVSISRASVERFAVVDRRALLMAEAWAIAANRTPPFEVRAGSDRAANRTPPFEVRSPPTGAELHRTAKLATRAHRKGRNERKELRFPTIRLVYAKARTDAATGEVTRQGRSYYLDVWDYLQAWAFRTLNDLQGQGLAPPTHADLAELFSERITDRGRTFHPYDGRAPGLSLLVVEEMAAEAASAALRDWTPTYRERQRRLGQIGRMMARDRGATWDDADLDELAKLSGMTTEKQAGALGRSRRTVERMRAALRDRGHN
jgi:hypothetical protein